MSAAIISGATGFIGAHLTRRLLRRGLAVHVLRRPASDDWRLADIRAQLTWHTVSLSDRRGLRRLAERIRPDYVFHLAAAVMHGGRPASPRAIVATTLLGTVNLIDACDAVSYRCFVHTGDAFEYGPRRRALRESDPCRPTTLDGIAKLAASLYALGAARQRDRPITVVRPFSIFGPSDDSRRLVPRLIAAALDTAPIALSSPRITRDFLYVDDLVDLYLALVRHPARVQGEVFNAASGRHTTLGALVRAVESITGAPFDARWGTYPRADHDAGHGRADISKTFATVGWRPRRSLAGGLARTLAAAAQARRRPTPADRGATQTTPTRTGRRSH
jgi:nucleoside-diphosphate-sugar epimerase